MKRLMLIWLMLIVALVISCASPSPVNHVTEPIPSIPMPASPSVPVTTPTPALKPVPKLNLEDYNGGFFSIKKLAGWNIVTAGSCSGPVL